MLRRKGGSRLNIDDEKILYNCYKKLEKKYSAKSHRMDLSKDKALAAGIAGKLSLMLMRLTSPDIELSNVEIQKYVIAVKGMFTQYSVIKGRNSSCINEAMANSMDELIRAVCKHEADMVSMLRMQETGGERIDILSIFNQKKHLNQLGNSLARTIITEAIHGAATPMGVQPTYFITDTGKRYHRESCPYCKGKHLAAATLKMVENQRLKPCKCLSKPLIFDKVDYTCVTAFIDESIHPVAWDVEGNHGKAGSYSYILCWGNLTNESQITAGRIIAQGVDYSGEHEHIERISEAAIGKVLISLVYDYEFTGQVHIYTDNQSAANHWRDVAKNSKLAKHFLWVEVNYIPREFNKMADRLGKSRMLLDLPANTYQELVKNNTFQLAVE